MGMIGQIAGAGIGAIPTGGGSGFTTGKASNTIADPTDSFAKAGLAGKVYDYWG
jgi:hypothetical protein